MTPATQVWSELLDQLEADLDAIECAAGDPDRLTALLAVGVGAVPAGPAVSLPLELADRARAVHHRFGLVEARLEVGRRQVRVELEAVGRDSSSVPRFIDAGI